MPYGLNIPQETLFSEWAGMAVNDSDKTFRTTRNGQWLLDYFDPDTKEIPEFPTGATNTEAPAIGDLGKAVRDFESVWGKNCESSYSDVLRKSFSERLPLLLEERFRNLNSLLSTFRAAMDASNIVSMTDIEGRITFANEEFCRISGYSREELIGRNHNVIRHPDMPKEAFADLWSTISSGKIWKGLVKNRKKDGDFYWVKTVIVPIVDGRGRITEYISVRTDVTDLEVAKERLAVSLKKLEQLDRKKSDFVNIASHELRTPVTVIRGYASMIEETWGGKSDSEVRTYSEEILKSANRLIRLINDMLDISKMEDGEEEFRIEDVDLRDLARDLMGEMFPLSRERKVTLKIEAGTEPAIVRIDMAKVRRALMNILGNAMKFTPSGGSILCKVFENETERGVLVRDTGVGIRKEDIPKIFEKFGQVENALTREAGGSGLWLPIAKEIVTRCGGRIEVESEFSKGSEFRIMFPK